LSELLPFQHRCKLSSQVDKSSSPIQHRAARQKQLHDNWGFTCSCSHCAKEAHLTSESDDRVRQIQNLLVELNNYEKHGDSMPEKAELLVQLFELEGMYNRVYEAYYRAAIEWNGVGQAIKAMGYARMCLDRGLTLRGPGRPFAENMQDLLKNTTGHWSWRFRVDNKTNVSWP